MEEIYYDKISDRPDYKNSNIHSFHILLQEVGTDAIINWHPKEIENRQSLIQRRLIGHKPNSRIWTKEAKQFLADNYLTLTPAELAVKLDKTMFAIGSMKSRLKLEGTMLKSYAKKTMATTRTKRNSNNRKSTY